MAPVIETSSAVPVPAQTSRPASTTSGADAIKVNDNVDLENQKEVTTRVGANTDSDVEGIVRQIELEANNSIQYRTCSWQMVCLIKNVQCIIRKGRLVN